MARRKQLPSPPLQLSVWGKFEIWVNSWFPGFKTLAIAGIGTLGSFAAAIQDYITNHPLDQIMSPKIVAIGSAILFMLVFWFHGMGERVDSRKD